MHVFKGGKMQTAIDRVMQAFTVMANLTLEEAQATRERLAEYFAGMDADEKALAIEGLRDFCADPAVSRAKNGEGGIMTDSLTKRPDRSKINMHED
jgi:flagellar motility protein MotE (MotC chaperone)